MTLRSKVFESIKMYQDNGFLECVEIGQSDYVDLAEDMKSFVVDLFRENTASIVGFIQEFFEGE